MIKELFSAHRAFWTRERWRSFALAVIILVASLAVQIRAGRVSARKALSSNFVHDIVLDNVPVLDIDFLIVQGAVAVILLAAWFLLFRPQYALFTMKTTALLVLVRAFFINLTNIGLHPDQLVLGTTASASYTLYKMVDFPGNYFFSGHTALPFLMALIFWREPFWRSLFLGISAVFGVAVLLAHIHYSIDVFAAPFIAYGVFRIAEWVFSRDRQLIPAFDSG